MNLAADAELRGTMRIARAVATSIAGRSIAKIIHSGFSLCGLEEWEARQIVPQSQYCTVSVCRAPGRNRG